MISYVKQLRKFTFQHSPEAKPPFKSTLHKLDIFFLQYPNPCGSKGVKHGISEQRIRTGRNFRSLNISAVPLRWKKAKIAPVVAQNTLNVIPCMLSNEHIIHGGLEVGCKFLLRWIHARIIYPYAESMRESFTLMLSPCENHLDLMSPCENYLSLCWVHARIICPYAESMRESFILMLSPCENHLSLCWVHARIICPYAESMRESLALMLSHMRESFTLMLSPCE
jgi:hypothetical protein